MFKYINILFIIISSLLFISCKNNDNSSKNAGITPTVNTDSLTVAPSPFEALYCTPTLDGKENDNCWLAATWYPMNQRWLGAPYTAEDFQGRYKLCYDKNYLYVLAEIQDDTIIDIHTDGLKQYWDDDCLEIFVDEDHSKGNHQYNYNAFAYHIALDNKVADMGTDSLAHYYNDHVTTKRIQNGNTTIWECAVKLFDDKFDSKKSNTPIVLNVGKTLGFAIAYCDNDHSKERENFIGSVYVGGEDKNRGWIDAGIFGTLTLK